MKSGNISGEVIDELSEVPVSGAVVSVSKVNQSIETDSDGAFNLANIPPGTYNVTAVKAGYTDAKKAVTVLEDQTSDVSLTLSRQLPIITPEAVSLNINKQSEIVEIENPGDGSMSLSLTASQTWISLDQQTMTLSSAEKKDLSIDVDFSSLDYGTYEEEVTIDLDGISLSIPITIVHVEQADIIWQNWYLSVPIDNGDGKATSIFYEDIINDNLTPEEKEYFYYDDATGSYVFWTRYTGYTTSGEYPLDGDAYCRTELREFWQGNQTTSDNWYMNEGETHILESTLNVDYVEGTRGRTFVAQIHGKESTIPGIDNGPATVKVLWEKGEIEVEYYVKPPDPDGEWTSDDNAKSQRYRVDSEIFTIKLKVDNGVLYWALTCEAKDIDTDYVELFDYAGNGYHYDNYFKTGNYFQWKSDYEKSAQVRLYKAITYHD